MNGFSAPRTPPIGGVPPIDPMAMATAAVAAAPNAFPSLDGNLDDLAQLATVALTSADAAERASAAHQLLFLSSFDHWNTVKTILPRCHNNYLRFIVCKAILFIVSNELGPRERSEMQQYVLDYMKLCREQQEVLPYYVRNELYSIYASALYSNWKLAVISPVNEDGGSEDGEPTAMAQALVERIQAYLTPEEMLDLLLEIVTYFSQQGNKMVILSVRANFAKYVVPYLFSTAASLLERYPEKAAEVCCTALECVPDTGAPLINFRMTSDPSVFLSNWPAWERAITDSISWCGQQVSQDPYGEHTASLGRLLRHCSTVMCAQESFLATRERLSEELLLLSETFLRVCQHDNTLTDHLRLGTALLVNVLERHEDAGVRYFAARSEVIAAWADAADYVLGRFEDGEDELRQSLMHLFYLLADRLLPPKRRNDGGGGDDLLMMGLRHLPCSPYGAGSARRGGPVNASNSTATTTGGGGGAAAATAATQGTGGGQSAGPSSECDNSDGNRGANGVDEYADGPLSARYARDLEAAVMRLCTTYLSAVENRAHLQEGSAELRTEAGVMLHNERTLLPLSEMLFCERVDFLPVIVSHLQRTVSQYEVCAHTREQMLTAATDSSTLGEAAKAKVEELSLSLMLDNMDLVFHVAQEHTPLYLMHVCLSRLSVLISIVAIAMVSGTAPHDDTILAMIASFARQLLTSDDNLTDALLQALTFEESAGGGSATDAGSGATPGSSPASGFGQGGLHAQVKLHLGVLRSLFFFCSCVYESEFSRRTDFYEVALDLLRFVYLHHSDVAPLVADGNALLDRMVTHGVSGSAFLGSDKLLALIKAVKADRVSVLQFPSLSGSPSPSPEQTEARDGFARCFVALVETRYYALYDIDDVVQTLVERALSPERLFTNPERTLRDLVAFTAGCHQPDTLAVFLDGLRRCGPALSELVRGTNSGGGGSGGGNNTSARCAATLVKWFAGLCTVASRVLEDDGVTSAPWELASIVLNTLCVYFGHMSYPTPANESILSGSRSPSPATSRFFHFPVDAVDVDVVYDLAGILHSVCGSAWCNLGILLYYERAAVEHFFCGAVEVFVSTSVPMLMSSETGRTKVFRAMVSALTTQGPTFMQLHLLFMRQDQWRSLLRQLTKCLSYTFIPEIVQLMDIILQSDQRFRAQMAKYVCVDSGTLGMAFHEVAVLIAVAPHLEVRDMSFCFDILQLCFAAAPAVCTDYMDRLLDFCSAYHRVRLRGILSMLQNNRPDMLEWYLSVFGQSSKVGVLSGW